MKLDIPYYIRQVLREKRMVNIPGIGSFKLEQTSSSFNDDKTIISPPTLNVIFSDAESDDQSLLRYILDTGLLSEEKAIKKIDQFTQSAFNNLLNVNSLLIEGIGLLTKNEGEEKVNFKPDLHSLTKEFSDLKPLKITPIARINKQNALAASVASSPKIKETGSFLPRILLLSLLLIALYFLGKYIYDNYTSDPDSQEIGITDGNDNDGDLVYDDNSQKELEQKYEEIDELIDPIKEIKDPKNKDNAKLDEELNNLSNKFDDPQKVSENEGMGGANSIEDGTNNPNLDSESNDDIVLTNGSTKSDIKDKFLNKHASIIPETGECIIIVGSFIKSLNTIKMISLLERKGYEVYQSEYKGYSRVGIKYECIDADLESYLQDIRKKISTKAWYLDPELEVPYIK